MKRLMFALAVLCLVSSPAFAYDYELTPTEDTFTDSYYYNQTEGYKHNGWATILVNGTPVEGDRLWAGATVNHTLDPERIDGTEFTRTYLKFDLTGKTNIDKADLQLYRVNDTWPYNNPDIGNVSVSVQAGDWNENTMTWQNSPFFDSNATKISAYVNVNKTVGGWVSWDVSDFAKSAQGGNFSLVLSTPEYFHIFESSEGVNKPFLGVNVVPEPISVLLFGIGGLTLAAHRKLKRRRS